MTTTSLADRQMLLDTLDQWLFSADRLRPDRPYDAVVDIVESLYAICDLTDTLAGETAVFARYLSKVSQPTAGIGRPTAANLMIALHDQLRAFSVLARHTAAALSHALDDDVIEP